MTEMFKYYDELDSNMAKGRKNEEVNKKNVFELLIGKQVVIQAKSGVMFKGTYGGYDQAMHILTNAEIVGKKNVARVDFVLVHKSIIHHINTEPISVEPIIENVKEQ